MGWKSFIAGLVVGALAVGYFILARQPKATDRDIILPDKSFNVSGDSASNNPTADAPDELDFSGTITGRGIGYPNNVIRVRCVKQDGKCQVATINQIGSKQIGDLELDEWEVTEWSPDYVVARSDNPETTMFCGVATFHVNLHTQEIIYTSEPVVRNMANERLCPQSHVDGRAYRWTIEAPQFWKATAKLSN